MTRKSVADVVAWEQHEVAHPSKNWRGLCMSHARSAWGQAPWATSAKLAWERVPHNERHYTDYKEVPAGAIVFDPMLSKYGHAWISAGHGKGYSTDYVRSGKIDLCDLHLPRWRHGNTKVNWTTWSPWGPLPVAHK